MCGNFLKQILFYKANIDGQSLLALEESAVEWGDVRRVQEAVLGDVDRSSKAKSQVTSPSFSPD